jgi:D-alanine--D-alanine ligase
VNRGYRVRGTDLTWSPLIDDLRSLGIEIWVGHTGEPIEAEDAVVLSDAIPLAQSPEVAKAKELGLGLFRRSQALGWLLEGKRTIAVTGSHGKTTTTGMIAMGLRSAGFDPTVVVGAEIPELGSSVLEGSGEFAVVEACEAYDSLHDFDPEIVVLLNLELDHIDFHETWENLRDSMTRFVNRSKILVYNLNDSGACEIAGRTSVTDVGFDPLVAVAGELRQKGAHNIANASAAWSAIEAAGGGELALAGIRDFGGAERRQQIYFDGEMAGFGPLTVIDDYAHHPTEVEHSLAAIKAGWPGRLVVVFQPHLYSRTAPLINEFAAALDLADFVVVTDIYPAREDPMPGVSSWRILEQCRQPGRYVPARQKLAMELGKIVRPGDVVVGMGAGNISEFAGQFVAEMGRYGRDRRKVLVAYGGFSSEREVSIHSGRAVFESVKQLGFETELIDLAAVALGSGDMSQLIGPNRPDLVFLAMHGEWAEDGGVQGFLETFGLPYTGCGIQSCAIAMDKEATKRILRLERIPVPAGVVVRRGDAVPKVDLPAVVKPNGQGSTVGLSFVESLGDLKEAIDRALAHCDEALVEELIIGIEISVPVIGDRALPPVEIVPLSGGYDFANKYTPGATDEICPARLTPAQMKIAMDQAVKCHLALGCEGITRTDMIVTPDKIVVLELNNLPGMTPTSLVRKSAEAAGMSFAELVDWIIQDGFRKAGI